MTNSGRPSLLLLASLALAATSDNANQVTLSQPSSQTFSLHASVGVESCAGDFVVSQAAGMDLETVTIRGTRIGTGDAQPDTFFISLHQSIAGPPPFNDERPGAVVASFLAVVPVVTATGASLPTSTGLWPEYELDFVLPAPASPSAGAYGVELHSTASPDSQETFASQNAPQSLVNGDPCLSWSLSTPGTVRSSCTPFPRGEPGFGDGILCATGKRGPLRRESPERLGLHLAVGLRGQRLSGADGQLPVLVPRPGRRLRRAAQLHRRLGGDLDVEQGTTPPAPGA